MCVQLKLLVKLIFYNSKKKINKLLKCFFRKILILLDLDVSVYLVIIPWTENLLTRIFLGQLFRYVICFANFSAYNIKQSFFLPKLIDYKYIILLIHLRLLFTFKKICRYLELTFKADIVEAYRDWNRRRIDREKFGKGFKIRHPLMRWQFLVLSRTTMHPYYAYSTHAHTRDYTRVRISSFDNDDASSHPHGIAS